MTDEIVMDETGRRSPRAERVAATRRALLDVARDRFGTQGFAATSIDEIVGNAGVTKGALYHHFTSKEHLFDSVFDEIETELADRGKRAALEGPSDPLAALNRGFRAFLDAAMETDVESLAQLLLGACSQAGMVIARSSDPKRTRRVVGTTLKTLINGLAR